MTECTGHMSEHTFVTRRREDDENGETPSWGKTHVHIAQVVFRRASVPRRCVRCLAPRRRMWSSRVSSQDAFSKGAPRPWGHTSRCARCAPRGDAIRVEGEPPLSRLDRADFMPAGGGCAPQADYPNVDVLAGPAGSCRQAASCPGFASPRQGVHKPRLLLEQPCTRSGGVASHDFDLSFVIPSSAACTRSEPIDSSAPFAWNPKHRHVIGMRLFRRPLARAAGRASHSPKTLCIIVHDLPDLSCVGGRSLLRQVDSPCRS